MTARDELAELLQDNISDSLPVDPSRGEIQEQVETAVDVLLAAGYRKPRTITTAEELDALPAKSAILDRDGTPWVGDGDKVEPWASVCEDPFGGPIWKNSIDIALPATVLYEPLP